jgi:hippurate hydrolase
MVGLRADMDALPMVEHNEFPWKSGKQGLMHGCGHDGHTTMLVGAARYLAATRRFDGSAVLVFQPAEEGRGGARAMIADGLFDRFPMQAVYAMHNWPAMRAGTVGINMGAMMAAADRITIEITGRGGHGRIPTRRWTWCWRPRTSPRRCRASSRAMCAPSTVPSSACAPCRPGTWAPSA